MDQLQVGCMRISGSFCQNGVWAPPSPSFSGEIFVYPGINEFIGFCDELYDEAKGINKTRYLTGVFAQNKKGDVGMAFYKLSNCPMQTPLLYVIPSIKNPTGYWCSQRINLMKAVFEFEVEGDAKISLEPLPYSDSDEQRIKGMYRMINPEVSTNRLLESNANILKTLIYDTR